MVIVSAGATDPGKRRTNNEDSYLLDDGLRLYAVADGVGGQAAGEVASRIAVETLRSELSVPLGRDEAAPSFGVSPEEAPELAALHQAVLLANRKVREAADRDPSLSGMATTLTSLALRRMTAFIAHVGDSRAYLFRAGRLRQLTVDHSFVSELVRAGALTPELARVHPARHVITRAVGIDDDVTPECMAVAARENDLFLLCTDGLTEMAEDEDISRVLASLSPRDAAQALIDLANEHGGVDNITALVVHVKAL
jgi:protein phosphatase